MLVGRDRTGWLPFLDTYRTMCRAPEPAFRRVLEDIREAAFWLKTTYPEVRNADGADLFRGVLSVDFHRTILTPIKLV